MYDYYGDVLVFSKKELIRNLYDYLKTTKKIYFRSPVVTKFRKNVLQWVSLFPEKEFSSRFLHVENGFRFYGDLNKAYYNPRYAQERTLLKNFFKTATYDSLGVIGAGIGPFPIVLHDCFKQISLYEINPFARNFSQINLKLNLKQRDHFSLFEKYDEKVYDVIVIVMPSLPLERNLVYKFRNVLVFYHLTETSEVEKIKEALQLSYPNFFVSVAPVRNYCKQKKIYRIVLSTQEVLIK